MRSFLSRLLPPLLLVVHFALLLWALVGLAEWFVASVPWPRLSNVLFPQWLLLWHWLAILAASAIFLGGYFRCWPFTPKAMVPAYAMMAAVCVVETFGFLTHPLRFVAMALEFSAYIGISIALRRVPSFVARFEPRTHSTANRSVVQVRS